MKKISVICPVYNTCNYLEKCIDSVLNQTYKNLELICIDDGSSDGSEKIVDAYAAKDPRVTVVHQKNAGESAARNAGLRLATGDYWTFIDCDDWLELDMYEKLVEAIETQNVEIAACSWVEEFAGNPIVVKNKGKLDSSRFPRDKMFYYIYNRDTYRSFGFMWDKLYKKECFYDGNGGLFLFDETMKLGGDIIYLAELVSKCKYAAYVDLAGYHYRQREDSGCHVGSVADHLGAVDAYERVIKLLINNNVQGEAADYAKRFLGYHCILISKIAEKNQDLEGFRKIQMYMRKYEEPYTRMNAGYPERVEQYREIMNRKSLYTDKR